LEIEAPKKISIPNILPSSGKQDGLIPAFPQKIFSIIQENCMFASLTPDMIK
jgi:hypothetical protein